ncbi:MAG TPA: hypothetical protein VN577_12810 [Terriglobales bacterium]|nr:hypothetical protein [Terriglobales bacterium]
MFWPRSKTRKKSKDARFADAEEMQTAFAQQHKALYWIALAITADEELATASIVDAASLAESNNCVFHDWLNHWAQVATARVAVEKCQRQISLAEREYGQLACSEYRQDSLSDEQITALQALNLRQLHYDLDALARSALILRGCLRVSIYECTLVLKVPLRSVLSAYNKAMQWYDDTAQQLQLEAQQHLNATDSISFGSSQTDLDPLFRRKDQPHVVPQK